MTKLSQIGFTERRWAVREVYRVFIEESYETHEQSVLALVQHFGEAPEAESLLQVLLPNGSAAERESLFLDLAELILLTPKADLRELSLQQLLNSVIRQRPEASGVGNAH